MLARSESGPPHTQNVFRLFSTAWVTRIHPLLGTKKQKTKRYRAVTILCPPPSEVM